jgi:hypothetical protein
VLKVTKAGSTTPPDVEMQPVNDGKNELVRHHPQNSTAGPLSRTSRTQPSTTITHPPVPGTIRSKYAQFVDEEDDDDRDDPVPVPDCRPVVNNFSNGIDRYYNKKRVRFDVKWMSLRYGAFYFGVFPKT